MLTPDSYYWDGVAVLVENSSANEDFDMLCLVPSFYLLYLYNKVQIVTQWTEDLDKLCLVRSVYICMLTKPLYVCSLNLCA